MNDLLHSLNTKASLPTASSASPVQQETKPPRSLIAPFGPVSTTAIAPQNGLTRTASDSTEPEVPTTEGGKPKKEITNVAIDWDTKSFKDCLPILAGLMGQPDFVVELKKVRVSGFPQLWMTQMEAGGERKAKRWGERG